MDESTRDLLAAISEALDGMADWRAIAVRAAALQAMGDYDPGQLADDLRHFLAQRRELEAQQPDEDEEHHWHAAAEREEQAAYDAQLASDGDA
jgi:hypothetical protein